MTIRNTSSKRLNVVLPTGLVASATAGQGQGRGPGGGGGFQSMGLGMFSNRPGGFGQFRGSATADGLIPDASESSSLVSAMTVPAGESLDVTVTAVCLNYGRPTPTARDRFKLLDVATYSADSRVRKSLRSLSLIGTSQGVAQAVMWRVCNDLTFEAMAEQAGKVINEYEIALAARFLDVLEETSDAALVDSRALAENRMFVKVQGEDALSSEARRLNEEMADCRLLGLPAHIVDNDSLPSAPAALFVRVDLIPGKLGVPSGRIVVSYSPTADQWVPLGRVKLQVEKPVDALNGKSLAQAIERAVSLGFVTVKPARRAVGSTILKVDNHLPFTLTDLVVKAGNSAVAPSVSFRGIGIGPARSATVSIPAASAVVERVELNGL